MEDILLKVYRQISLRIEEQADDSYSYALSKKGTESILKKIGEEFLEVALASETQGNDQIEEELADLFYHILLLMVTKNIKMSSVSQILNKRLGQSGIAEKNSRQN